MNDFRALAACRELEPELFFPVGTTGPALDEVAAAKRVCARCPVRRECLSRLGDRGILGDRHAARCHEVAHLAVE